MKLLKRLLSQRVTNLNEGLPENSLTKGQLYEMKAESHLHSAGLTTRAKNFRCKSGEIDLIMQHKDTLVFVEVRYRKKKQFGGAIESVNLRKKKKLATAASLYLSTHKLHNSIACRFDVVAFEDQGLQWIQNAFELSEL